MKKLLLIIVWLLALTVKAQTYQSQVWVSDQRNGEYINPILHADYSDPDVIRVGDDYYMTASSFNCVPGLPILRSKDLINWRIIGHALQKLTPKEFYDKPRHGSGVYAPCIRYHKGEFRIYWGDPDFGIYVVKTKNPAGKWDEPILVKAGKGMIDPSPLFDDDGKVYLSHAWAGSRSRIHTILSVCELNGDGTQVIGPEVLVFDGTLTGDNYVEGTKFYKRNGYYYILAPAGGVQEGWQLALRSKSVFGPYERKIVLEQGTSSINGPHQGGWVETPLGESWFLHFQDKYAYGRIVHLQPVSWIDDWPEMGVEKNGKREPVMIYKKPDTGAYPPENPAESDEFNRPTLGLQWQWQANPKDTWCMLSNIGFLRLYAVPIPDDYSNFWSIPNLLLQKFPAEEFTTTVKLTFSPKAESEKAGLIIMGLDYSYISISKSGDGYEISQTVCNNADHKTQERTVEKVTIRENTVYMKVSVGRQAHCRFAYSTDGKYFVPLGESFTAKQGKWIGAKIGLFSIRTDEMPGNLGYVDFDWFRIEREKITPRLREKAEIPACKEKFHLYLLAGQSNMAGRGFVEPQDTIANPRILRLNGDNAWEIAKEPLHFDKPEAGVGPGFAFACEKLKSESDDVIIGLIPCAVGGSSIDIWKPGKFYASTQTYPYDEALKRTLVALKNGVLKGILWHQGESDRSHERTVTYKKKLVTLVNTLRDAICDPFVPFIVGELPDFRGSDVDEFNEMLHEAKREIPYFYVVPAYGLTANPDSLHIDAVSQRELGKRYAETMRNVNPRSK